MITHAHFIYDSAEPAPARRCVDQSGNGIGHVLRFLLWIVGQRLFKILENTNWRLGKLAVAVITARIAWLYQDERRPIAALRPPAGFCLMNMITVISINEVIKRSRRFSERGCQFVEKSASVQVCSVGNELPLGNGERVLVIDDEPSISGFQKQCPERLGYQVDNSQQGCKF
ncbi:MAG: hypothetical protein PVI54_08075 [Desulfobacteraceae bacterium]